MNSLEQVRAVITGQIPDRDRHDTFPPGCLEGSKYLHLRKRESHL
jgi:hypothetical protein